MSALALSSGNWKSLLKGVLVVGGAAALTYAGENIANLDFGKNGPMIVMGLTVLISYLRRVLDEYSRPTPAFPANGLRPPASEAPASPIGGNPLDDL